MQISVFTYKGGSEARTITDYETHEQFNELVDRKKNQLKFLLQIDFGFFFEHYNKYHVIRCRE